MTNMDLAASRNPKDAVSFSTRLLLIISLGFLLAAPVSRPQASTPNAVAPKLVPRIDSQSAIRARAKSVLAQLPLRFEKNQGQSSTEVKFLSQNPAYSLFLTPREAVLKLRHGRGQREEWNPKLLQGSSNEKAAVLRVRLVGANANPLVVGVEELPGKSNHFIGNDPKKWHTDVPNYARVRYEQVYPGVDLEYYGNQTGLEYDFNLAPGADGGGIKFEVVGEPDSPATLQLAGNGDLIVKVGAEELRINKPVVYQPRDASIQWGAKNHILEKEVSGRFVLETSNRVSFELSPYDHSKRLVIDPAITYSTYLGGTYSTRGFSVAANADPISGHVYAFIAGATCDSDFPTKSALQPSAPGGGCGGFAPGGTGDAFVAKIDPTASGEASLVWSTYLGAENLEFASGVAVDNAGNVYLVGNTNSSNFPTVNSFQTVRKTPAANYYPSTRSNVFLSKLSADGSTILYSTYFGGSRSDSAYAIALDSTGRAYIAGQSASSDMPTVNPLQATNRTSGYAAAYGTGFLAIFDTTHSGQSSLVYSTYLGGSSTYDYGDAVLGLAVDALGGVHLGGYTTSTDFPTTPNGFQRTFQAGPQGLASVYSKLNPAAVGQSQLVYSTFLGPAGGSGGRNGVTGVAADPFGNAYVVGNGLQGRVPFTPGAYNLPGHPGDSTIFVAKISSTLSGAASLIYGASWSIPGDINANTIAVDGQGNAYIGGHTPPGFPLVNPVRNSSNGVFESLDAGSTWSSLTKGIVGNQVSAFAIDTSTSPRTLYAGNLFGAIFASADGGLNWNQVLQVPTPSWINVPNAYALAVDPSSPTTVYAGTTNGVYRTTDRGVSWNTFNNGLSDTAIQAVKDLEFDGSTLYAGTPSGLYRLLAGAGTWTATTLSGNVQHIAIDPTVSPHTLYASGDDSNTAWHVTQGTGVWKSTDGGLTWTWMQVGPGYGAQGLVVDPTTVPATLYAEDAGSLFASTDGGSSWQYLNRGNLAGVLDENFYAPSFALDTSRTPSIIYASATGQEGIAVSFDGGSTWNVPLWNSYEPGVIAIDPTTATLTSPAVLYATTGSKIVTEGFVAELDPSGSSVLFSTYLSGIFGTENHVLGIAPDASGNIYVTGVTSSSFFPVPNAFQRDLSRAYAAAYLTKIGTQVLPTSSSIPVSTQVGVPLGTLTVSFPNITGSTTNAPPTLAVNPLSSTDTANFSLSNNLGAYDISTTASYSGSITLCFQAQTVNDLSTFNSLRLVHIVNGAPVDVTTSRDFSIRSVCGSATSLSPFILVSPAAPAILWNPPKSIIYGTALSGAQLNASTEVTGSFTYMPFAGTVLNAGSGQTLSVTFTPVDTIRYKPVTKTVTVNVLFSAGPCNGDMGHTVLQPINGDGTSVFKLGSTVPTKFRVCDAKGTSISSPGTVVSYQLIGAGTASGLTVDEDSYSTSADNAFRWDSSGKQWIFNQATGKNNPTLSKTNTIYTFKITLNDGSSMQFQYGLK